MNDPWDVKYVRKPGQYLSCMKINGIPLLPPLLSKDCRNEMQYYKVLAKEVETRITLLKSITDVDGGTPEDLTDATELPDSDIYEIPKDDIDTGFQVNIDKITAIKETCNLKSSPFTEPKIKEKSINSKITVITPPLSPLQNSPKLIIDLSLNINENGRNILDTVNTSSSSSPQTELPERDYNSLVKPKEILCDTETIGRKHQKPTKLKPTQLNLDFTLKQDGPSSLSSKSFTGSLNDIHTDSMKENKPCPNLIRQRSYTVLDPSPQLLDYLENQCLSRGVDLTSISMSESRSNLSSPCRKRRSWDLETAKVKWSSMAQELKQNTLENTRPPFRNHVSRSTCKSYKPNTMKPLNQENLKRGNMSLRCTKKSETTPKALRSSISPVRDTPVAGVKSTPTPKPVAKKKESSKPTSPTSPTQISSLLISDSEDPATKVRELYEKIQKQQMQQMANLVEKQKREQALLQQAFEEQNKLLYKQLKTIVPKSPVEAKEAWVDKVQETRGPVSLSQLINSPENSLHVSPVSSTLTDMNNCINKCNNILKRSRNLTGSLKKSASLGNYTGAPTPPKLEGSLTRTHSPTQKSASRKLVYENNSSSPSASDREHEPPPTDRTNDTLADLNVTFNTDYSDDSKLCDVTSHNNNDVTVLPKAPPNSVKESLLRNMEMNMYNFSVRRKSRLDREPTAKERAAACTIVAYAKGYLVRRLLGTERVQATVQTIRDALLCALDLHRERGGIRGADVDLHRRLIQQITAACYSLHETFISSSPAERCAAIAADRLRRRTLAAVQPRLAGYRPTRDIMSHSYSGEFPRTKRPSSVSSMTQSHYETYSEDKGVSRRYMPNPRRRPWR